MNSGRGAWPSARGLYSHRQRLWPSSSLLAGEPAEVLDPHQGDPGGEQVEAHLPARRPPFDRHVHRVDVGADLVRLEVAEDQVQ